LSRNRLLVATGLVILLASCVWIATNVLQKSSTTISQTAASNSPPAIPATAASRPQDSTATTPSSANSAATSDDLLNMAFCGCAREATMEKLLACQNQCVVEMQRKSDESHKRALEAAERLRP
jgi:hypothetical protein